METKPKTADDYLAEGYGNKGDAKKPTKPAKKPAKKMPPMKKK